MATFREHISCFSAVKRVLLPRCCVRLQVPILACVPGKVKRLLGILLIFLFLAPSRVSAKIDKTFFLSIYNDLLISRLCTQREHTLLCSMCGPPHKLEITGCKNRQIVKANKVKVQTAFVWLWTVGGKAINVPSTT